MEDKVDKAAVAAYQNHRGNTTVKQVSSGHVASAEAA